MCKNRYISPVFGDQFNRELCIRFRMCVCRNAADLNNCGACFPHEKHVVLKVNIYNEKQIEIYVRAQFS